MIALTGSSNDLFGWSSARGDFNADGQTDTIISAIGKDNNKGELYLLTTPLSDANTASSNITSMADYTLSGESDNAYMGWQMMPIGDVNADGATDLLLTDEVFSANSYGIVRILSGACFDGSVTTVDEATIYSWSGEEENSNFGSKLASGDIDGDGQMDIVMGAFEYNGANIYPPGRAYIYLSSQN